MAVTQDLTASTHIDLSEKIGRNKPCPCGSGKKYR
ncbi:MULTISPECIES: SEC-C metal-binding domain-containing protein [Bifidobacterium]